MFHHAESTCSHRNVCCDICHVSVPFSGLGHHKANLCVNIPKLCSRGCGSAFTEARMIQHQYECPKRFIRCDLCGCDDSFADELEYHLDGSLRDNECPMRRVICSECKVSLTSKSIDVHCAQNCPRRLIRCNYCKSEINAIDIQNHISLEYQEVKQFCNLGCQQMIRLTNMENHQELHCPKRNIHNGNTNVTCQLGCGIDVKSKHYFLHMTEKCPKRLVSCILRVTS